MTGYVRECVLSCRCRTKNRSSSQQIAMLLGRAIQPGEVIEMDLISVGVESL